MSFKNKTVVVTGAGRGIGLKVAETFIEAGAKVYCLDLSDEVSQVALSVGATGGFQCDVSDPESVGGVIDKIAAKSDSIDVLVNAAGIHRQLPFLETSLADFQLILGVNLVGTFIASQAVARKMAEQGKGGAIVNFSSVGAEHTTPNSSAYAASKGGVTSLTRAMAVGLAPHQIRVNAVAPGPVETPMNEIMRQNPEYVARMIDRVPLGRQGQPEDIAQLVLFLAGEGSSWITGEVVRIDGGISVLR